MTERHANGLRANKRRKLLDNIEQKSSTKHQTTMTDELPSLKDFASSDPKLRRNNLNTVLAHIEARPTASPFSSTQCLQLWRAFSVSLYMHDSKNAISVQNLIAQLVGTFELIHAKDSTSSAADSSANAWLTPYTTAFWETLVREWSGIDSHRMNKYLLLVRLAVRSTFKICLQPLYADSIDPPSSESEERAKSKALAVADAQMKVVESVPLDPKNRKASDGLRLHLLDIWNDEVTAAWTQVEKEGDPDLQAPDMLQRKAREVVLRFMQPVEKTSLSDSGAQRPVRTRAKEVLAEFREKTRDPEAEPEADRE